MQIYKDLNNNLFQTEDLSSVLPDWVAISEEEAKSITESKIDHISLCKNKAKGLLAKTDWAMLPDVQITNKADFENYRAILRGYVISPVANPTWPTEPQPVWN